ncbi:hypothetical protein LEMLEM_LOCUS9120, partial [Lemmus lemmus]
SRGLSLWTATRARTSQPSHQAPRSQVPFGVLGRMGTEREEGNPEMTGSLRYN